MGELATQSGHDKNDTKVMYDILARDQQDAQDFEENMLGILCFY